MRSILLRTAIIGLFSLFQWAAADNVPDVYQGTWSNMSMGKSSQMMFYISKNKDFTRVTRAIIAVHGLNRDPWNYFNAYNYALNEAWSTGVDPASLVLMAPFFPNGNDKATASGANARPIFNSTNQLCWSSNLWAQGAPASNSRKTVDQGYTSHQALNALITYFGNKTMFPAMKEVVMAGHSAGAQLTNSWTTVGKPLTSPLALRTIVGAPGTFVWLDNQRPIDPNSLSCPTFNDYNYGLDNFTYGTTPTFPNSNFASLDIIYNYGSNDNDPNFAPADPGCEVQTQGNSHATRMQNYYASLLRIFGTGIQGRQRLTVNPGGGHSDYANQYSMWIDFFSPILSGNYPITQSNSTSLGCFLDSVSSRSLPGASTSSVTMDIDTCLGFCARQGFSYAGVEYGQECYCGSTLPTATNAGQCTITCGGNSNEFCGGANALNVYQVPAYPVTPSALGCFADHYPSYRAMANASTSSSSMTAAVCGKFCATQGYKNFGTEYGQECYCSDNIGSLTALPASSCSYTCAGDRTQMCGGSNALSVYTNIAGGSASASASVSASGSAAASASSAPSSTASVAASDTALQNAATSLVTSTRSTSSSPVPPYQNTTTTSTSGGSAATATGTVCLTDGYPHARTLTGASFTASGMTNGMCSDYCFARGYAYSGTEYGGECYCGQTLSTVGGVTGLVSTGCTMPCGGDKTQLCGGSNAVLITTNPTPATQDWQPAGCWADHYPSARMLTGPSTSSASMTPAACLAFCWSQGQSIAGLEYASQCFCGSALDAASGALAPSACSYPCSGDATLTCGGSNALQVYNNVNA